MTTLSMIRNGGKFWIGNILFMRTELTEENGNIGIVNMADGNVSFLNGGSFVMPTKSNNI